GVAYSNRGLARAALGEKAGALSDLRKALELDPTRRDKIQAAIDSLSASDSQPADEPAPRRGDLEPPPEGPATVTLEDQGDARPARAPRAPSADLDDTPPSKADVPARKPAKRGKKDLPPERSTGEEDSQFIQ
ncbi:MAG: tetratricopeptide repeat protein, partial [Elusimicrobia bacterium]|nr:tetratricopeptide repeat protein [Elusimicrobiota bacterium]